MAFKGLKPYKIKACLTTNDYSAISEESKCICNNYENENNTLLIFKKIYLKED